MNKKIPIGIGIGVVILVIMIVGAKSYFGDSATELPGEEKMEKTLNLQEASEKGKPSQTKVDNEANEKGEAGEKGP